jgi:hypothetical protein
MAITQTLIWRAAAGASLAGLLAACSGGATSPGDSSPPPVDHPPVITALSFVNRTSYNVLSVTANDPDGTAVALACTGTLAATGTNTLTDSALVGTADTVRTYAESCTGTSNGKSTAADSVRLTVAAVPDSVNVDFYRVDLRSQAQFATPATLVIGTDTFHTTDGHWVVREPLHAVDTIHTVSDTDAFKFDRIEDKDHNLVGVNWPQLDGVPLDFSALNGPYTIYELSEEPGPDPSQTFNKVTYPSYAQAFSSDAVPVIPIVMAIQPKQDTLCDAADATTLQTFITAATGIKATLDSLSDQNPQDTVLYKRTIVEMDSVPLVPVTVNGQHGIRPARGYQLICEKNSFGGVSGAFNGTYPDVTTGEIISSSAQISPGIPIGNARGEIYPLHVGKQFDGLHTDPNNYTFYTVAVTAYANLLAADRDRYRYVTVLLARPGMLKYLQWSKSHNPMLYPDGSSPFYPAIVP